MSTQSRPRGQQPLLPLRLAAGIDLLDKWAQDAPQSQKNIVNSLLFSVVEKRVFSDYDIVDDVENHMELFVLTKADLTVKIRIYDFESFGIVYVGESCSAPGLDRPRIDPMEIIVNGPGAGETEQS
jgi:hypothetical protein